MLFSEVYGTYFNAVADVISKAIDGELDRKTIYDIVAEKAFGESLLNIPNALLDGSWRLLNENCETPIANEPTMPLTTLQKRWMKAVLLDERVQLFNPSTQDLDDVEPLFKPSTFVYFDRYHDGDNYSDPIYKRNFHIILTAIKEHRKLKIKFSNNRRNYRCITCIPRKLEYSSKDDKFRLIANDRPDKSTTINLGRVYKAYLLEEFTEDEFTAVEPKMETLIMDLVDERNALERVMLHFSHFEKETEKLDDTHYRISLKYSMDDETEVLIRVISFGPKIKVLSPQGFINQIQDRINKQMSCELK
ncbi:MAG: WYL domain-containing protein [Eubacterium sp.]